LDSLSRYNIIASCAGEGFSIFLSNYGVVLSCGDNSNGSLGHGDVTSISAPKAIGEKLFF
jgi:NIMA (never in mitosis gene a)-related kinase 8